MQLHCLPLCFLDKVVADIPIQRIQMEKQKRVYNLRA